MQIYNRIFWSAVLIAVFLCPILFAADNNVSDNDTVSADDLAAENTAKAAIIPCKGLIDDGLFQSIKRRTALAESQGCDFCIYQIETYGGLLKSGDDISKYFILEAKKKVRTVAYVTTEAISAGAMISVACEDIIMKKNTLIGDAAPITMGGKLEGVEREKIESFTRAGFERASEANGYPAALLKAMVSAQLEVYRIKNLSTGEYEFYESTELPSDPNLYALDDKELIVKEGELLTLTASKAREYNIARAVVDDFDQATAFLEDKYNVSIVKTVTYDPLWSEQMVRWINSPGVLSVLVMAALLAGYVELNTPGLGLPGLVAVICLIIIVGSKYLVGMANWIEIAVFIAGIILLLIELFVLPGFGLAGAAGIICIFAGLFGMLIKNAPDEIPWPATDIEWMLFLKGAIGLMGGVIGFIIAAAILAKFLPRWGLLSGLVLAPAFNKDSRNTKPAATYPAHDNPSDDLTEGQKGKTLTLLRPAGTAKFGEKVVDVVSKAEYIGKNQEVVIDEIHGNRVVVKKIQG
jgi:membrane-bound serine protease (ClpP class)